MNSTDWENHENMKINTYYREPHYTPCNNTDFHIHIKFKFWKYHENAFLYACHVNLEQLLQPISIQLYLSKIVKSESVT